MNQPAQEPTAAQVVALANRLLALKASPGFHDLRLIAEMLEQEARAAVANYQGNDRDELFNLNQRAQIAARLITELFGRIDAAIANASGLPFFQAEEPGEPLITTRIAGSY